MRLVYNAKKTRCVYVCRDDDLPEDILIRAAMESEGYHPADEGYDDVTSSCRVEDAGPLIIGPRQAP